MNRRWKVALVVGVSVAVLGACADSDETGSSKTGDAKTTTSGRSTEKTTTTPPKPAVSWEKVAAPEPCECSDGSEYHYWIHRGDPKRVLFALEGGGACFSAETCKPGPDATYKPSLSSDLDDQPGVANDDYTYTADGGVFDLDNPENPLAGFSVVYVPYCSGDVHLGNATHDYGKGVVIEHKGRVNAGAALDGLAKAFPDAEQVVVHGASAGSAGSPLYGGLAHDVLPNAQITVLADASGAYPPDEGITSAIGSFWGSLDHLPTWPESAGQPKTAWSLPGLFIQTGRHVPGVNLATINTASDEVQRDFADAIGFKDQKLVDLIDDNNAFVEDGKIDLSSWVGPGDQHVTTVDDGFYEIEVDGTRLVDWVAEVIAGKHPDDVHCETCG